MATTLTKADMIIYLHRQLGLEKDSAKNLVENFFEAIKSTLEKGEEIKLSGFGKFKVRQKKPRPGRNPKTGQETLISARRVVTFHVGEKLKSMIEQLTPNRAATDRER